MIYKAKFLIGSYKYRLEADRLDDARCGKLPALRRGILWSLEAEQGGIHDRCSSRMAKPDAMNQRDVKDVQRFMLLSGTKMPGRASRKP